jgi:hypothetical protein
MGFNKYFVPEPGFLVKQLTEIGPTRFMANRIKDDLVIGSSESISILNRVQDQLINGMSDDDIIEDLKLRNLKSK